MPEDLSAASNEGSGHLPRQARLRPEATELYPDILPDVWLSAAAVTEVLWTSRTEGSEAQWALTGRVLNPEHFDFRFGRPASGPTEARRRITDPDVRSHWAAE